MRVDNSVNTNLYTNDANADKVTNQQNQNQNQKQNQTILLQEVERQEQVSPSNYFEGLSNLGANFLAFKLKQEIAIPKQNSSSDNSSKITSTATAQKEELKQTNKESISKSVPREKIDTSQLDSNWKDVKGKEFANQNDYDKQILESIKDPKNPWPDFSPKILKSMVAQESGFKPKADNGKGFVGLTQMNKATAEGEGKLSFSNGDPRTEPDKIIPGTLRVLTAKDKALEVGATIKGKSGKVEKYPGFNYYGKPNAEDKVKFALAAYNGGQGKVLRAIKEAYGDNIPKDGVKFDDVERFLPTESRKYVKGIIERAEQ